MKLKVISSSLIALLAASLCHANMDNEGAQTSTKAAPDQIKCVFGGGFVISPGYQDYIDDAYFGYNDSGGAGWLDLYAGLEINVDNRFSLLGGCDVWFNAVDVTGGTLGETYVNHIIIPSIFGQVYLDKARMFYVNGGLLLPMPTTGSTFFEFEGDGIGFGANVGIALADGTFRLEGGVNDVPVTAKTTTTHPNGLGGEKDYNFGGFQMRFLFAF